MCLACGLPDMRLLSLTHAHIQPTSTPKPAFPFNMTLLASWPWCSEDRSETDRLREGLVIHLMSACQPAQTSLGKQSLARESCKHHRPEWHNPSNYLSSLDCGPAPYREAGCGLMVEHTNTHRCKTPPTATWDHSIFHDIYFWQCVAFLLLMPLCFRLCLTPKHLSLLFMDSSLFILLIQKSHIVLALYFFVGTGEFSSSPPPPSFLVLACLKVANPIFFCHPHFLPILYYIHHPNQCLYCSFLLSPSCPFLIILLPFFFPSLPLPTSAAFSLSVLYASFFRLKKPDTSSDPLLRFFLLTW